MRKEIDNVFRVSAIFFTAMSASCGRVLKPENPGTQTPTTEVSPMPSPSETFDVATATHTVTPSFIENPNIAPTLEMSYVRENIDFGTPGKLSLSITEPFKYYSFGDIVVYPDHFKEDESKSQAQLQQGWLDENFHPGKGTMVSKMDNLGNVVLFIHDGYMLKGSKPLEAEAIRSYIEGGQIKTIEDPDHIKITMQSLVGAEIEMTKGEGVSKFTVQAIVQIPHDQVAYYDSAAAIFENVYTISQNANKTDGATEVIEEYIKNGGGTAISICGWKIVEEKVNGTTKKEYYTTHTRYVIFLEPVQTDQK
jgi:hypothetical protein